MNKRYNNSGFSAVEALLILVVVGILGFTGWFVYHSKQAADKTLTNTNSTVPKYKKKASTQPSTTSTNLVTDNYAPASVSFTHSKDWTFDTSGETYGYSGHPNEKGAKLYLRYQDPDGTLDRYTIGFGTDSVWSITDAYASSFEQLGKITLGGKTQYVIETTDSLNKFSEVVTSGCPDKECSFTLPNSSTYFTVQAIKGVQNGVALDNSMIPEIVSIFESMELNS